MGYQSKIIIDIKKKDLTYLSEMAIGIGRNGMGYRSEVAIGIRKEVKAWALIAGKPWPKILSEATHVDGDVASYYTFDWVKWYLDDLDVHEVHAFFDALDEHFPEIEEKSGGRNLVSGTYGFLRVGEEIGDIETLGNPYDFNIYPQQTISEIAPV